MRTMLLYRSKLLLAGCLALLCLAAGARACSVPVFRYALERWPADAYQLTVFHREPLSTNQQALLDAWRETSEKGLANIGVALINVSNRMSASHQTLWKAQTNALPGRPGGPSLPVPWLVALYPREKEIEMPVWAGPLNAESLKTLVDSPARREMARRLCKGDSAVWLLLESGDKTRDEAVATLFEKESRALENSLKLPEADAESPQVRSEVPLRIAFSLVRVSRSNPAEQMFRDMLLHMDTDLATVTEPVVFAVFGRGRALPMPIGKDLRVEVIRDVAEFLTSACSCEVKTMNPGVDLLIAADWEGSLEGRVVKDPELPPLIGMTQFAATAVTASNHETNPPPIHKATATGFDLAGILGLVVIGGVVVVGIGTLWLKVRRRRP